MAAWGFNFNQMLIKEQIIHTGLEVKHIGAPFVPAEHIVAVFVETGIMRRVALHFFRQYNEIVDQPVLEKMTNLLAVDTHLQRSYLHIGKGLLTAQVKYAMARSAVGQRGQIPVSVRRAIHRRSVPDRKARFTRPDHKADPNAA